MYIKVIKKEIACCGYRQRRYLREQFQAECEAFELPLSIKRIAMYIRHNVLLDTRIQIHGRSQNGINLS